jgi:hypothetical protein
MGRRWIARTIALIALVWLLASQSAVLAQGSPHPPDADALLPSLIGDVPMYRLPVEFESAFAEFLLEEEDFGAVLRSHGLDPGEMVVAVSTNFDLAPYVAAITESTIEASLTEAEAEAYRAWRENGVWVFAIPLRGADTASDVLDSLLASSPADYVLTDVTIGGRRIVGNSTDGLDPDTMWAAWFAVGDVLYTAYSYASRPTMLEAAVAIPDAP